MVVNCEVFVNFGIISYHRHMINEASIEIKINSFFTFKFSRTDIFRDKNNNTIILKHYLKVVQAIY